MTHSTLKHPLAFRLAGAFALPPTSVNWCAQTVDSRVGCVYRVCYTARVEAWEAEMDKTAETETALAVKDAKHVPATFVYDGQFLTRCSCGWETLTLTRLGGREKGAKHVAGTST